MLIQETNGSQEAGKVARRFKLNCFSVIGSSRRVSFSLLAISKDLNVLFKIGAFRNGVMIKFPVF